MKYTLWLIAYFSLLQTSDSFAQQGVKTSGGVTSVNQSLLVKRMDSIFQDFNKKSAPGFAITIIQNGKVLARRDYGMASIEFGVPFSHKTVVRLPYSEGREFISIAAAIMEKDGLLTLNDKVNQYFPKLPKWSENITLQDLLNHSSGFCDEWATLVLTQAEMANRLDVSQFLEFLYRQPDPQVEPRKGYMYSNSDFGLLRMILEKACGKNLSVYMKERLFVPLGMVHTKLGANKEKVIANHAFSYAEEQPGKYTVWMRDKTSPGGNYWILTSAEDLEKWAAAHADAQSIVYKATQRLKRNARPIPVLKGSTNYVFGHKIKTVGSTKLITHEGVSGYAYLTEVPAENLSIVCIGNNLDPYSDKTDAMVGLVLNKKEEAVVKRQFPTQAVPISKAEMRLYEGNYRWLNQTSFQSNVERKQYSELKVIGDSMWLIYSTVDSFPLIYVGNGIFKDPDYPIWNVMYQPHADSPMRSTVYRQTANNDSIEWVKVTITKKSYSIDDLRKLCGIYHSKHLDFYWRIELNEAGQLVLKRPTISDKIIEPGYDDDFKLLMQFHTNDESWAWINFHFNSKGEVEYLDVRHSRLMHHRFNKQ